MAVRLACGHEVADPNQIHYCDYLRLGDLLTLQPPRETLRHPDEHLFIVTHQAFELWFTQILFDLPRLIEALDSDNVGLAIWLGRRLGSITSLFSPMIRVLEGMAPSDFFAFRAHLSPASGTESHQFREIEILAGLRDEAYHRYLNQALDESREGNVTLAWTQRLRELWEGRSVNTALMELFERRGVTAASIYAVAPAPNPNFDLFLLAEALLDFDEDISLWRNVHARMAERSLGAELRGTGHSSGVRYLDYAARRPHFFPALWGARGDLWEAQSGQRGASAEELRAMGCPAHRQG